MRQLFVPTSFNPPQESLLGKYRLVPIKTSNTQEDLDILLKNADAITETRGAGSRDEWPYNITFEENLMDLAWLELCARYRQLFSYIIRDEKKKYIGALYIYPIELFFPEKAEDFDVDFSFWIIQSELDKGTYQIIYKQLITWIEKKWPFPTKRVYLRNKLGFIG